MAEMKYLVVRTDKGELQVHWGSRRPASSKPEEVMQRSFKERWVPDKWQVVGEYPDEAKANKALEEELDKAPPQTAGKASNGKDKASPQTSGKASNAKYKVSPRTSGKAKKKK